jgi:hypothetical protein
MMLILVFFFNERDVNVIFADPKVSSFNSKHLQWLRRASIMTTRPQDGLPLFVHLKRYPGITELIMDFSVYHEPVEFSIATEPISSGPEDIPHEHGDVGIQELRIHLPRESNFASDRSSAILSRLAQTVNFTNLRKLHIAMNLMMSDHGDTLMDEDGEAWRKAFRCIDPVAASWKNLEVIKICAHVHFFGRDERLAARSLWVSNKKRSQVSFQQFEH